MRGLCKWKTSLAWIFGEFTAREDHGEDHVNSITAPVLRGGTTHKALPCSWVNEGWACESPGVCPDVDVGNFQHESESDSTSEISSFHLKSESEKAGPLLCVGVWGGSVESEAIWIPGYTAILPLDLEHLTSSL